MLSMLLNRLCRPWEKDGSKEGLPLRTTLHHWSNPKERSKDYKKSAPEDYLHQFDEWKLYLRLYAWYVWKYNTAAGIHYIYIYRKLNKWADSLQLISVYNAWNTHTIFRAPWCLLDPWIQPENTKKGTAGKKKNWIQHDFHGYHLPYILIELKKIPSEYEHEVKFEVAPHPTAFVFQKWFMTTW